MRTSTKIYMALFFITLVGAVLTSSFFFSSISITSQGVIIDANILTYISIGIAVLNGIFGTIIYVRFLKSQKLTAMLFFSIVPISITFATATYFLATINNYSNTTLTAVKQVLQINENNYNNYLWIALLVILYLLMVYILFKVITKPLKKLEQAIERLSDGKINEKITIGGGRQFEKIAFALNKINNNYKEKETIIEKTNNEVEKYVPKQFVKYLGKNNIIDLTVGTQVTKEVTALFCDIRTNGQVSKSISLEENFNLINSYLNVVSPIIKKYNGFVDKYYGDGIMSVFMRPRQAYDCALAIIKAVQTKNYSNINTPNLDVGVALNTGEVVFGVVGDDTRKSITILSNNIEFTRKIGEVNKVFGSLITFSKDTLNSLSAAFDLNYRYVGNLKKSDNEYVSIFESLDTYPKVKREKLIKNKLNFEQGVRAYVNGKFDIAKNYFEGVYKKEKDDKVCYVFYNKAVEKS